jgi:hypothetical protein
MQGLKKFIFKYPSEEVNQEKWPPYQVYSKPAEVTLKASEKWNRDRILETYPWTPLYHQEAKEILALPAGDSHHAGSLPTERPCLTLEILIEIAGPERRPLF